MGLMVRSRLQQKYRRRTAISLALSVVLAVSLTVGLIFYLPEIILAIASMNSKLFPNSQSSNADTNKDSTAPITPILDPLTEATSNPQITITGTTEIGSKVHLYLNGSQISSTPANKEGIFSFEKIKLNLDKNEFYAIAEDFTGNKSDPSASYTVILETKGPSLSVNGEINNKEGTALISGTTDIDSVITISNRRAIVNRDGSFTLELKLSSGENKIQIKATNPAGNTTEQELVLNYSSED